jgi:hypothetical protein
MSNKVSVPSADAVMSTGFPSSGTGENAAHLGSSSWLKQCTCCPVATFVTITLRSREHDATSSPEGENETWVTAAL